MKTKELTVSMSRKHNLGNYENVDFFSSLTVEIEPGDNPQEVYAYARTFVMRDIALAYEAFSGQRSDQHLRFKALGEQLTEEAMEGKPRE